MIYIAEARDSVPRFGFIVSKSVGNAVVRNRVRRRMSEVVRAELAGLPLSDVVIRAFPAAADQDFAELAAEHDALVISDEIHAPLVHPGSQRGFVPFLTVSDATRRVGIALHSPSKAWNTAGLKLALGVTADQCAAVSVPVASPGAGPSEQRPEAPDAAALSALHGALLTAGEAFSAQALAGTAAHPLLWAAMTAWTRATAAQFDDPTAHREPARSVLDAAEQAPDAALQAALDALGEAVHGIELAAGTPGLGADEVAAARARIDAWFGHRDALTDALGPTPTPVPTPAAPWFEVPRPGEPTQARALIARVEAATMPILGRAFAFGPNATRPPLLEALADAATDVPRWGGLVERWPGLPVS